MPNAQDDPLESSEVSVSESQNRHVLVSTPRCSRLSSLKKAGVQEVLRSKLTRIQQGLSKKRDSLVQSTSGVTTYEQPTFYIPTPIACLEPELDSSRPLINESKLESKPLLLQKDASASFNGIGSRTCNQRFDSVPIEPEPDYDDFSLYCTNKPAQNRFQKRWSVMVVNEAGKIPKAKLNNTNHDLRVQPRYTARRSSMVVSNADLVTESVAENNTTRQYVASNAKQKSNLSRSSLNEHAEQVCITM